MIKTKQCSRHNLYIAPLLMLVSWTIYAEPTPIDINKPAWQLWAKPRICVLPANKIHCEMETELNWTASLEANVCLSSSQQKKKLHCWQQSINGRLNYLVYTESRVYFWLTYPNESTPLIKTFVHIVNLPEKKIRKRRRRIWSLM